ncbi:MAG: HAD family hydrolase [Gammaproteobacteria bacterium]|nr:MAG: HAD family hydrolase [Gammaproteobacteria bacterium]
MLKALIFDVDGTLAETERLHLLSFNAAFAETEMDWAWDDALYRHLLSVGGSEERVRYFLDTVYTGSKTWPNSGELAADLRARKDRHFRRLLGAGALSPRPGVSRLITEARAAGLRLGIATSASARSLDALSQHVLPVDDWFDCVVTGDSVSRKKPAPDAYCRVMDCLGVSPAECIAFEDSTAGLESAVAAGVVAIATVSEFTDGDDFSRAAVVLEHLGDPGAPARVVAGDDASSACVDLDYLRALHERTH